MSTSTEPGTTASCRGCGADITRLATATELWEDGKGITVCTKSRPEDIGKPNYIYHLPMPEGLRGAPAGG